MYIVLMSNVNRNFEHETMNKFIWKYNSLCTFYKKVRASDMRSNKPPPTLRCWPCKQKTLCVICFDCECSASLQQARLKKMSNASTSRVLRVQKKPLAQQKNFFLSFTFPIFKHKLSLKIVKLVYLKTQHTFSMTLYRGMCLLILCVSM